MIFKLHALWFIRQVVNHNVSTVSVVTVQQQLCVFASVTAFIIHEDEHSARKRSSFQNNRKYLTCICVSGIVIPHIFSISTPLSDCLASVDICMSDLCRSQGTFSNSICGGKDSINSLFLMKAIVDTVLSFRWCYTSNDCISFGG